MCPNEPQTNPYDIKIKLTRNFGPLSITFSLRRLFSAKMAIFCLFGRIGYREPERFQSKKKKKKKKKKHRWFLFSSSEHIFTTIKTKFKVVIFFALFLTGAYGVYGIFRSPVQGVPVN